MTSRLRRPASLALVLLAVVALAACGDDDADSSGDGEEATTTTIAGGTGDLVLGSGELPDTVPDDFPVAEQAVIGSTISNPGTGETEIIVRYPTDLGVTVEYHTANLEERGYTIDRSEAVGDSTWEMEFSRDGRTGSIDFEFDPTGVTQVVVVLGPTP